MRRSSWLFVACLLAAAAAPQSVHAAPSASGSISAGAGASGKATGGLAAVDKRVRVHISTDVFSLVHFNPDGANNDFNTTRLGFGIGRRTLLDWPTGGVGGGVTSIGVGGVILGGHGVIGGQFAFAVDGLDVADDGGTAIEGRFVPYFNYMFNPSGRITPFVGAHFGLGGGAYTDLIDDPFNPGNSIRVTTNVIYPVVGAQGGVHIFVVPAVSIDALVNFDYMAPFGRSATDGGMDPDDDEDYDKIGDIINVAFIRAGLSVWF